MEPFFSAPHSSLFFALMQHQLSQSHLLFSSLSSKAHCTATALALSATQCESDAACSLTATASVEQSIALKPLACGHASSAECSAAAAQELKHPTSGAVHGVSCRVVAEAVVRESNRTHPKSATMNFNGRLGDLVGSKGICHRDRRREQLD